jgi:hypothetical protein
VEHVLLHATHTNQPRNKHRDCFTHFCCVGTHVRISSQRTIASARFRKSSIYQEDVLFIRVTGALMAAAVVCFEVLQLACQKSVRLGSYSCRALSHFDTEERNYMEVTCAS